MIGKGVKNAGTEIHTAATIPKTTPQCTNVRDNFCVCLGLDDCLNIHADAPAAANPITKLEPIPGSAHIAKNTTAGTLIKNKVQWR